MPYSAEHKSDTRKRIVTAAAELLRTDGIPGTGVAKVMKHAGLTHGGFYAHFKSKDDLVSAAFEEAVIDAGKRLTEGLEDLEGSERLKHYIGRYLSRVHRDNPELGCPLASLGAELSRGGPAARAGFENGMRRLVKGLNQVLPDEVKDRDGFNAEEDEHVLGVMSMMVGGLMLSRSVEGQDYSDHILRTTRRAALKLAETSGLTGEKS
jgi:TetR/AcrR family transcriptional regulator, transcriptional repressor for nem operon